MSYSLIIKKLRITLQVLFLSASVLLFGSASPIVKFFLGIILVFLTLINISNQELQQYKIFLFIVFFYLYLIFNTYLISKIPFESKFELLNYILYFLTFTVFTKCDKDEVERSLTISFFLIQTTIFVLYLFGKNKIIYFLLYNPNIICGFTLAVFFFSFFNIKQKNQKKIFRFFGMLNFFFSFLFFILFKNLTSILIVFLFLIYYFPFKWNFLKFFLLMFSIILSIVYNFTSFFDRIIWILIGLKVFFEKPIFGVGLGCFKFYYPTYSIYFPFTSTATSYIHNFFLQLSTELGIIGLFLILFVIFYSYKNYRINEEKKFFFPLISLILSNFLDYNLAIPQNAILFSVLVASLSFNIPNEKENLKLSPFKFLITIILFLNLFLLSIKLYKVSYFLNILDKRSLKKALSIDNTCWYAYKNLAIIEIKEKNFEEALNFLNKTLEYNPFDAETYFYIALLKLKMGEKKEGFKFYKEAIKLNPKATLRYKKEFLEFL